MYLVRREDILTGRILNDHALFGPEDILKHRTRENRRSDARLPQDDAHVIAAGGRLRLNAIVLPSGKNQETSFGTRVLDGRAHQRVDQFLQHDLTRYRFGYLDHRRQIEMLDWCLYRRGRIGDRFFRSDLRIELLELPNLAIGAPLPVAVAGVAQVGPGDSLETTAEIEARRQLAGNRLVLHKAVAVRRTDGFFVKSLSLEHPAFDPGDFRTGDRGAALEGVRVCSAHPSSCLW